MNRRLISLPAAMFAAIFSFQTATATNAAADPQLDGEWVIYNINGQKVDGEERPYLTIEKGRFYGNNGCNVINGDVSATDSEIKFSNLIASRMYCKDAPFEYLINTTLGVASTYSISRYGHEYYLDLMNERGHVVMVLRKHNMDFLNGAWRVARIDGMPNANENLEIVIDIPEKKIHGNTGCNILNGEIFIDPDKHNSLQFLNLMTTRTSCSDMSTETSFLVALEAAESAIANDNNTVTLYDARGHEIMQLCHLDPAL